jgi:DNA (cytosine-5)-methyltransferase 1
MDFAWKEEVRFCTLLRPLLARSQRCRQNSAVRKRLTAIDLFSGCGGLSEGLRQAGFRLLGAVDNDNLAVKTYRRNHPRVRVWEADIRTITGDQLRQRLRLKKGELDLLAGCPPCQGFSRLRTKNRTGIDDERNDLVLEFVRLVRELLPRAVMMENVPALAMDPRIEHVKTELRRLGYAVRADVLDAAEYAVPQRRRRFVLIASRVGSASFARRARVRPTVRDAFARVRPSQSDPLHRYRDVRSRRIETLIRKIPKDGGSRSALPPKYRLACHENVDGFKDVYGRMAWDSVSPTITGGCVNPSRGRFLHPEADRSITLREAAALQTFPPRYYISMERGKYAAAQLIGNALPPEFIRRHAASLHRSLERAAREPASSRRGRR